MSETIDQFQAPEPVENFDEEATEVEEYDEPDTEADDTEASTGGSRASKGSNRALIRRVVNKAEEVINADARTRSVASHLLGCSDDMASLVTAIMTAERGVTRVVNDLNLIAESNPFEASVHAGALGRDRMKKVWSLLGVLGLASDSDLPTANSKAAIALAQTIHTVNLDEVHSEIETVTALLKKS